MFLQHPRGLRDADRVTERRRMLQTVSAAQPLVAWTDDLRTRRAGAVVPDVDPADAGVDARALFVLEAPGPMTNTANRRPGSGFVSVDNDDQTAANVWSARDAAGLHEGVLVWNVVPWFLGASARKPTVLELADGGAELASMIRMLPELRVVVLCGRYAQRGWPMMSASVAERRLTVVETWHPSPQALNQPGRRAEYVGAMRSVAQLLGPSA